MINFGHGTKSILFLFLCVVNLRRVDIYGWLADWHPWHPLFVSKRGLPGWTFERTFNLRMMYSAYIVQWWTFDMVNSLER